MKRRMANGDQGDRRLRPAGDFDACRIVGEVGRCANEECGHRLSASNHEQLCRPCQAKEFHARVNGQAPGPAPRGGGPMMLQSLRRSEGTLRGNEAAGIGLHGDARDDMAPVLPSRRARGLRAQSAKLPPRRLGPGRDVTLCERGCGKPMHRGNCEGHGGPLAPCGPGNCKRCGRPKHRGNCKGVGARAAAMRRFFGGLPRPDEREALPEAVVLCGRGNPHHRGSCKGEKHPWVTNRPKPKPKREPAPATEFRAIAEKLEAGGFPPPLDGLPIYRRPPDPELVAALEVKACEAEAKMNDLTVKKVTRLRLEDVRAGGIKPGGRMGELWRELLACTPEEPAIRFEESTPARAGEVAKRLRVKGERLGRAVETRRHGTTVDAWLKGGAAGGL